MSVTTALLDRWKAARHVPSDNQAALTLGLSRATISKWRANDSEGNADTVERLARDLNEDPTGYVLMAEAHKQSGASRRVLEKLAQKFRPFAAALVVLVAPTLLHGAPSAHEYTSVNVENSLLIMSNWKARIRRYWRRIQLSGFTATYGASFA